MRESATNILKYAPEKSIAKLEAELDSEHNIYIVLQNEVAEISDTGITGGFGLRNLEDKISQEGRTLIFGKTDLTWILSAEIPIKPEGQND
ncbi:hypothetical protein RQN30_00105 [Arcanobacterium hippocoleae]